MDRIMLFPAASASHIIFDGVTALTSFVRWSDTKLYRTVASPSFMLNASTGCCIRVDALLMAKSLAPFSTSGRAATAAHSWLRNCA